MKLICDDLNKEYGYAPGEQSCLYYNISLRLFVTDVIVDDYTTSLFIFKTKKAIYKALEILPKEFLNKLFQID